jgi:hypothetical protein
MFPYQKRIGIDFDGVIHRASRGKFDGTIYDEPNLEVVKGIVDLLHHGDVVFIHSARAPQEVADWMDRLYPWFGSRAYQEKIGFPVHCIPDDLETWNETSVLGVTRRKHAALIYIDDHGFHFRDN